MSDGQIRAMSRSVLRRLSDDIQEDIQGGSTEMFAILVPSLHKAALTGGGVGALRGGAGEDDGAPDVSVRDVQHRVAR